MARVTGKRPARRHGRGGAAVARRALLRIDAVGAQGDGIGMLNGNPVFVPWTAVGDLAEVEIAGRKGDGLAARLLAVREAGPGRATPPCRHFGDCGGCAVQHLDGDVYGTWKFGLLPAALGRRGFVDPPLRPPIRIAAGTRRRAALAALRRGPRVLLGFHARAGHRVVDLAQCEILLPALVALLEPLRAALAEVLPDGGSAELLLVQAETGIDLLMTAGFEPTLAGRQALARLAETCDVARLSWSRPGDAGEHAEPVALRRAPVVRFGGIAVTPPPGPFLQPSAEGEAALVAAVIEATADARRVADLYSGCGTFTFPLAAAGARVHAVDGAGAAVAALAAAARAGGLGNTVSAERRDLDSRPLLGPELEDYDAVLLDPPRAGARAQAGLLAGSTVRCVVAVSCNPATFARDARILVDGGYRLEWIQPVDQFPWTGHLELVAAFKRAG